MPMTKLQEMARAKYISPKEFIQQFSLSKTQGYNIINMPEMQEAVIKIGDKGKRINIDKAFEIMANIFN